MALTDDEANVLNEYNKWVLKTGKRPTKEFMQYVMADITASRVDVAYDYLLANNHLKMNIEEIEGIVVVIDNKLYNVYNFPENCSYTVHSVLMYSGDILMNEAANEIFVPLNPGESLTATLKMTCPGWVFGWKRLVIKQPYVRCTKLVVDFGTILYEIPVNMKMYFNNNTYTVYVYINRGDHDDKS